MIWDILMGSSSVVLAFSLFPQVLHNIQNQHCGIVLKTSLTTAVPLTITCISMLALELYFAGVATSLTAITWWVIVFQSFLWSQDDKHYP